MDSRPETVTRWPRAAWYAVAHAAEVDPGPLRVELLGQPYVLARIGGTLLAAPDRCPHRSAPLSEGRVVAGGLACPYHGWRFAPDGRCVALPGLVEGTADTRDRRLQTVDVRVQDELVWLAPEPPEALPPSLPPLDGRTTALRWRFQVRCDPVDALENFLDATHTHTVHPGLVRREGARRRVPVTVRGLHAGVEAVYDEPDQSGAIMRWFGADVVESRGVYRWPCLAELGYRAAGGRDRLVITASFVPAGDRVDVVALVRGRPPRGVPGWLARALIGPFLRRTVAQDRAILERVAANRARVPGRDAMSPLDLLRPHIDRLLADPTRRTPRQPRTLELEL